MGGGGKLGEGREEAVLYGSTFVSYFFFFSSPFFMLYLVINY